MLRKFTIFFISLSFCLSTLACASEPANQVSKDQERAFNAPTAPTKIADGKYPVQQATYNDANGEYSLMLLNTPPGTPAMFRTTDLQMARLTDEEITAGEKTYLKVESSKASMHLTENFQIAYVHNVTETKNNPQTGRTETVVVRQESSFWAPFAGAVAGQALGNLLFAPRYYMPPVYQSGTMRGYGSYGNTYDSAVQQYQTRYQSPPPAVKNTQTLRTTGRLRSPNSTTSNPPKTTNKENNRSSGSGYGSSDLRPSNKSTTTQKRSGSFGSGRSRSSGGRRR
jgi:hypothetical protein